MFNVLGYHETKSSRVLFPLHVVRPHGNSVSRIFPVVIVVASLTSLSNHFAFYSVVIYANFGLANLKYGDRGDKVRKRRGKRRNTIGWSPPRAFIIAPSGCRLTKRTSYLPSVVVFAIPNR